MPWNPETYNKFKTIRYQPFYDLIDLIDPKSNMIGVDLGCGTGEQTYILSKKFKDAHFLGVDSSADMLAGAQDFTHDRLHFQQSSIENFLQRTEKWDLIFSNAALQWTDSHEVLFPQLLHMLSSQGQLAVQIPVQKENLLNHVLWEIVQEEPFSTYLKGWKRDSPVLSMDEYATLLFANGLEDLKIMMKVYPIIAENSKTLIDFIAGSALIPYMERLSSNEQEEFLTAYEEKVSARIPVWPMIYAFKRILLHGKKK